MGPESVPIPGQVEFRDGLLIVIAYRERAVGVSLLWEWAPIGAYHMETTRLPPRDSRTTSMSSSSALA